MRFTLGFLLGFLCGTCATFFLDQLKEFLPLPLGGLEAQKKASEDEDEWCGVKHT